MSQHKPIAFEIEVKPKNSPVKNLPIKMKLEQSLHQDTAAPTLEEIDQKLKKAEEKRKEEISRKLFSSDEKQTQIQERKSLLEKE
jgi:hypothetical protein